MYFMNMTWRQKSPEAVAHWKLSELPRSYGMPSRTVSCSSCVLVFSDQDLLLVVECVVQTLLRGSEG